MTENLSLCQQLFGTKSNFYSHATQIKLLKWRKNYISKNDQGGIYLKTIFLARIPHPLFKLCDIIKRKGKT